MEQNNNTMLGTTFVLLTFLSLAHCIPLNQIQQARLIANVSRTLFNQSQQDCICQMISSLQSISALNYCSSNQTCQLFSSNLTLIDLDLDVGWIVIYTDQSLIANMFRKLIGTRL
ncbi:unnamed protein product [Adineta ricciae]|uniref:Apple domain-containing protein n=1 Tax=Adineta ricciae TaxID=249248 RepID=A0A814EEJ4_ADIRI|nr:unnamed protein product [Adineta ricciae]